VRKTLQKVSAALMVPVVILPIGALFLALGSQLALPPLIAAGRAILLDYLPLLFAVGVSIGFTGYDGMAGFAGVIGYLVLTASLKSINSELDMGVLGGILSGLITAFLYHKFQTTKLPEYLGLFSGKRFVTVLTAIAALVTGSILGYVWQPVQIAIFRLGGWIMSSGPVGLFFYGLTNRLLIPTGLHHIINNLILYTFGTFTDPVSGVIYQGEVQRFFAGDPTAGTFSAGFYIIMLFAIPAACLAIIHEARPENRKRTAGILITAALTSIVTGITEPAEFTFMFAAPILYAVHALLTGGATLLAAVFNIRHYGYALPMYFINWSFSENAWLILPLGLCYATLYYFGFRFLIRRFNLTTLGRESEAEASSISSSAQESTALAIVNALGGLPNLINVDACMTRLRLVVRDTSKIDEKSLKQMGATAVSRVGSDYVQVIMGTSSQEIAEQIRVLTNTEKHHTLDVLVSPLSGTLIPLKDVKDDVFARGLMGHGVAVIPVEHVKTLVAPLDCTVEKVFPGGHAFVLRSKSGRHILIHVGIDTVALKGEGFNILTKQGANVQLGEQLLEIDWRVLREYDKDTTTMIIFMDSKEHDWDIAGCGEVTAGVDIVAKLS